MFIKRIIYILLILLFNNSQLYAHKVFILQSYHSDNVCGGLQERGIKNILSKYNCEIKTWNMYTRTKYTTESQIIKQSDIAIREIYKFNPHILCTIDDNAFKYVGQSFINTNINVVFTGLNSQPDDYPFVINSWELPGHNITGVYEKLHIIESIKSLIPILGKIDTVLIIMGYSNTSSAVFKQIMKEFEESNTNIKWVLSRVKTFKQYVELIYTANESKQFQIIYPVALSLKGPNNLIYGPAEILRWTSLNSMIPTMPVNISFVDLGIFGGLGVDFYSMGEQAGQMIKKIIYDNISPSIIPIENAEKTILGFNLDTCKLLEIKIPQNIIDKSDYLIGR